MGKRLKPSEVVAIRKQYRHGYTITDIAAAYGRSHSTISAVVHGRRYTRVIDLPDVPPLPNAGRNSEGKRRAKVRVPAA